MADGEKRYIIHHGKEYDIELLNSEQKNALQMSRAHKFEIEFAELLTGAKLEMKSEQWLWERTGNICFEYKEDGRPSGLAVTTARIWVEHVLRDEETLCWILFPMERAKELARTHKRLGHYNEQAGDGGRSAVIYVPFADILRDNKAIDHVTEVKLACLERELRMRKRVYPRWVANGKMSEADARREIGIMEAIRNDYRQQVQPSLLVG